VADLALSLAARRDVDHARPVRQLLRAEDAPEVLAPDRQFLVGGDLVEDGDRGLVRAAAQREAYQQRNDNRVDNEHAEHERRTPEDLDVLEEESADALHDQWPRWRRNATKASSKSRRPSPGLSLDTISSSSRGVPQKSRSPSARTSTLDAYRSASE